MRNQVVKNDVINDRKMIPDYGGDRQKLTKESISMRIELIVETKNIK